MGIFDITSLLEAEIDGQQQQSNDDDDFTAGTDDESGTEETPPATNDEPTATEGGEEGGDGNATDDVDFTEDAEDTDFTDEAEGGEEPVASEGEGGEAEGGNATDDVDFTDEAEGGDGGSTTPDESGGGSEDEPSTGTESGEEPTEGGDDDLKKIESELFSNLSPEQMAIKNTELKERFITIYTTIGSTLVRINDIPKSKDNIELLKFVTDKLLDLRDLVDYNITTVFQTRTYVENNIVYQQCLSILDSISAILASIPSPTKNEDEDDNDDNVVDNETDTKPTEPNTLEVSDTQSTEESVRFDFDI